MTDYTKEAKRLAQAYADAVLLGEGNDEALAALLAHIQRGAGIEVGESVTCEQCGHENWIMYGKAPAHIQRGAVPEGWHLDESEAALLHHLTSPDDDGEHSPITLRAGNVRMDDGVVKFGLLCEYTDYPEEGATLLVECQTTSPDHFRDAAKMAPVHCTPTEHDGRIVYEHTSEPIPNADGFVLYAAPAPDRFRAAAKMMAEPAEAPDGWEYYYKDSSCPAADSGDPNCICWHDEGRGPYDNARHDDEDTFLEWRRVKAPAPAEVPMPDRPVGFIKPDTDTCVYFYEQDFYVLSNFSAFSLVWKGRTFPTSEHAYHWEKFSGGDAEYSIRYCIRHAPSAHEAFKIAERCKRDRRPEWDEVKVDTMREILRAKVEQHEYVRRKLLATGDRELIEDSWRDDFWGWGPNRNGKNMLGKLWMEIRADLRGEVKP